MNAVVTTLIGVAANWASLFCAVAMGLFLEQGDMRKARACVILACFLSWASILLLLVRS